MSNNTSNNDYFAGQIEPYVENMDFASWDIDQTPELTYLQQFDVILLQENGLTGNSANIGDILAEYVLDGGNLILSTFIGRIGQMVVLVHKVGENLSYTTLCMGMPAIMPIKILERSLIIQ